MGHYVALVAAKDQRQLERKMKRAGGWDWWDVGGQYENVLKLKGGVKGEDSALSGEVDWAAMRAEDDAPVWAFLDAEGLWYNADQGGFVEEFWKYVTGLSADQRVYICDCHY
jgi:hypothetical protein